MEDYAKKNGYAIVGYYIDEGKSARKKYTNHKEFMRMMEDVKSDKIDVILFIKLDRWFRSVADYYKIQEILDAHGVAWKTTQEHYRQLESRSIRTNPSGRVYIFSGLLVCGACGQKISGHYTAPAGRQEYYLYRCRNAVIYRRCPR